MHKDVATKIISLRSDFVNLLEFSIIEKHSFEEYKAAVMALHKDYQHFLPKSGIIGINQTITFEAWNHVSRITKTMREDNRTLTADKYSESGVYLTALKSVINSYISGLIVNQLTDILENNK